MEKNQEPPPEEYPVEPYVYSALPEKDSVRLLLLQPASSSTTEIRGSLIHTTLRACEYDIVEHYVALSYVWGSTAKPNTIWIDGLRANVTANLYSAFQDLRDRHRVTRLWIDALCINQEDDNEKSVQISMMPSIYRLARVTVIYLGPFDPGAEQLLRSPYPASASEENQRNEQIATLLVSKEWFRRIWVFQELVFSREPWVQYGSFRWTWDFVYGFLESRKSHVLIDLPLSLPSGADESSSSIRVPYSEISAVGYKSISEMERARVMYQREKDNNTLSMMSLLPTRRGLGCTEPADMIHAYLSFAAGEQHRNLVTECSKSFAQVYEDFAFCELESSGADILSHIEDRDPSRRPAGLASWAPDWRTPKLTKPLHLERPVAKALSDYKTTKLFEWQHLWVYEPRTLVLLGHVVDSVTRISIPLSGAGISPHKHSHFSARLLDIQYDAFSNTICENDMEQLVEDILEAWRDLVKDDQIMPPRYFLQTAGYKNVMRYLLHNWVPEEEDYDSSRHTVEYLIRYSTGQLDKLLVDGRVLAPRK